MPLAAFLLLEAGLRLLGFGKPASFMIPDERPGYFRTNPDFAGLFLPGNFDLRPLNFRLSRHKAPGAIRIVVLGESAAQGVPVPSFGFASQLRAQMRSRYPGKEIEVINTGIVAINSHVVYQIAREMARFEPDLFVVYMGNNEVVGPYGPGCAYLSQMPPLWIIRASVFVRSTRTGQLLGSLLGRIQSRARAPAQWGGMSMFVDNAVAGDDPRLEAVYSNFAANLKGIIAAASGAGAKTILCTVVANMKDCAPFLSRHREGLSPAEGEAWQAAFNQGRLAWRLGDAALARERLSEALRIDPQYADTEYMLGLIELHSDDVGSARRRLANALHWDALRFRPDPRINAIIREVASENVAGVSLLDAAMAMGADPGSASPLSGREILFEHVHFDWEGSYRLARMIAESCAAAMPRSGAAGPAWLDSAACAEALAYTQHERLPMLLRIDVLVRKPPFTNQLTYVEDQARMAREIDAATQSAKDPAVIAHAAAVAKAALSLDPDNPALAGIAEGIDLDVGDLDGALALARRAQGLLPRDFATSADEASILLRMGRYPEAGKLLMDSAGTDADLDLLAPVLENFWAGAKRFEEGRKFLDAAIARKPEDRRLQVLRGDLLEAAGDTAGAEREFRSILAGDSSSEDALESLVNLLSSSGRQPEAEKASLAAAGSQPRNEANNLRAAKFCEEQGNEDRAVRFLEAAEHSGPVNATIELTIALKLYKLGRPGDILTHLAHARSLSLSEGSPSVTEGIDRLIERMRRELPFPG